MSTAQKVFVPAKKAVFAQVEPGDTVKEFNSLRVEANRPLSNAESHQLFELVEYAWITMVRGQELTEKISDTKESIVVDAELGRSFSSKPLERFDEFLGEINDFIRTGSPVRRNGSRKVEGMDIEVTVWVPVS